MKYTIPEMTFEDQIYSLFSYSKPPVIKVTDLNKIYKIYEYDQDSRVSYNGKYHPFSLYNVDFAVDPKTFEENIFQAFKSHAFCINEKSPMYVIEEVFNNVLETTLNYAYGNQELQVKRFEYFKSLVNVMNKIIEDKEIKYPSSLFKIAVLNKINHEYLTNPSSKMKESLLYFSRNIKKEDSIRLYQNKEWEAPYAFIMYLIILTKFKDEQKEFKNLIWNEFNETNSIHNAYRLKSVIDKQNIKKIDFTVIDKDVLLDKIEISFLMEMRSYLIGKSKIKDSLTTFLEPLTNEKQKKEMFLKSIFNKNIEYKYVLIEKKYFPHIINTIEDDDIINAFNLNDAYNNRRMFFVKSLNSLITDENNFIVKMLGVNYNHKIKETNDSTNLSDLSTSIAEAFRIYKTKEERKDLKKLIGNVRKKSSLKQRI